MSGPSGQPAPHALPDRNPNRQGVSLVSYLVRMLLGTLLPVPLSTTVDFCICGLACRSPPTPGAYREILRRGAPAPCQSGQQRVGAPARSCVRSPPPTGSCGTGRRAETTKAPPCSTSAPSRRSPAPQSARAYALRCAHAPRINTGSSATRALAARKRPTHQRARRRSSRRVLVVVVDGVPRAYVDTRARSGERAGRQGRGAPDAGPRRARDTARPASR